MIILENGAPELSQYETRRYAITTTMCTHMTFWRAGGAGATMPVIETDNGYKARIPDNLIANYGYIEASATVDDGNGSADVVDTGRFYVRENAIPENYAPDDYESPVYQGLYALIRSMQSRMDAGEFIGETGPVGPQGDPAPADIVVPAVNAYIAEYLRLHPEATIDEDIIRSAVNAWLANHPEYVTTVMDNSISAAKLTAAVRENVEAVPVLKQDLNEHSEPFEWINGYYALGNGVFTPQSGTVTYHSTPKFDGIIPNYDTFIHSEYLGMNQSFFPVWDGATYRGYLMAEVWHNPNGSITDRAPKYDKYAITLHDVASGVPVFDYTKFRKRKYALLEEEEQTNVFAVSAERKSSLLVDEKTIVRDSNYAFSTANSYGYIATKRMFLKSYKSYAYTGINLFLYLLKKKEDGTYETLKSYNVTSGAIIEINEELNVGDAILVNYTGGTQHFSTDDNSYFSKVYGWNSNTRQFVESSINHYLCGTVELYDPISNYILDYTETNPCNYKGTECSVFDNFLCIGDSITQGAPTPPKITPNPSYATREVVNKTMYSYPASMKKQFGVDSTNWGHSGITSQGWYDEYKDQSWSGHDSAIILIGNNDYRLVPTLTDENLNQCAELSKAAMMRIISKLKADNAGIKIFICTLLPSWSKATSLAPLVCNNIRNIAETESNVFLIDLAKYSKVVEGAYQHGHPTALGYNQIAREIGGAIGYTVRNNPDEFRWIQHIGTEYAMDVN